MVFLSATNVLGYLVTNQTKAVIFFGLVSLITHQFSKNMAVILLIAVISTNFLMVNGKMREGLENEPTETNETTETTLSKIENSDPEIANAIDVVKQTNSDEIIRAELEKKKEVNQNNLKNIIDTNNSDLNTSNEEGPEGVGEMLGGKKNYTKSEHFGPRLDYAATIEQSYQNLDNILGSDSIKQLTNDTQKLMAQQQNLFNTMQNMVPVLQGAQNLLKDFDIGGLTTSLKGIGGLDNAQTMMPSNKQ